MHCSDSSIGAALSLINLFDETTSRVGSVITSLHSCIFCESMVYFKNSSSFTVYIFGFKTMELCSMTPE